MREAQLRATGDKRAELCRLLLNLLSEIAARAPVDLLSGRDAVLWRSTAGAVRHSAVGERHYLGYALLPHVVENLLVGQQQLAHENDVLRADVATLKATVASAAAAGNGPGLRRFPMNDNCHECGKPGHRLIECERALAILAKGGELKVRCKYCKKRTHFAKDCPEKKTA